MIFKSRNAATRPDGKFCFVHFWTRFFFRRTQIIINLNGWKSFWSTRFWHKIKKTKVSQSQRQKRQLTFAEDFGFLDTLMAKFFRWRVISSPITLRRFILNIKSIKTTLVTYRIFQENKAVWRIYTNSHTKTAWITFILSCSLINREEIIEFKLIWSAASIQFSLM